MAKSQNSFLAEVFPNILPFHPILPGDWRLVDARLINSKLSQLSFALKPDS